MAGEVKKISGRLRSAGGRSLADQLGLITWNHINETDEVERVLPVNDQKSGGLLVQVKILAQQAPEGEGPGARSCLLRIVPVITKGLDVARDISFNDENPFERRARSQAAVMIDGKDALAQIQNARFERRSRKRRLLVWEFSKYSTVIRTSHSGVRKR